MEESYVSTFEAEEVSAIHMLKPPETAEEESALCLLGPPEVTEEVSALCLLGPAEADAVYPPGAFGE